MDFDMNFSQDKIYYLLNDKDNQKYLRNGLMNIDDFLLQLFIYIIYLLGNEYHEKK